MKSINILFNRILPFIAVLALAACGGGGGGGGGETGSTFTINGKTYVEGSVSNVEPFDPAIAAVVDFNTPFTNLILQADYNPSIYFVTVSIIIPSATTGSFPVTGSNTAFVFADIPQSVACAVPTGGTVTVTQNDGVFGGRLVGTFTDVTFDDLTCVGVTLSGSFSVAIDGIV